MNLNDLEKKYFVKVCFENAAAQFAYIFLDIPEIKSKYLPEQIYPLKEGLDVIVKRNLRIYLFDGLRDFDEDEFFRDYLLRKGLPPENIC